MAAHTTFRKLLTLFKTFALAQCQGLKNCGASALAARVPPNPSIEGMPKRLRLLVTPHVKR